MRIKRPEKRETPKHLVKVTVTVDVMVYANGSDYASACSNAERAVADDHFAILRKDLSDTESSQEVVMKSRFATDFSHLSGPNGTWYNDHLPWTSDPAINAGYIQGVLTSQGTIPTCAEIVKERMIADEVRTDENE